MSDRTRLKGMDMLIGGMMPPASARGWTVPAICYLQMKWMCFFTRWMEMAIQSIQLVITPVKQLLPKPFTTHIDPHTVGPTIRLFLSRSWSYHWREHSQNTSTFAHHCFTHLRAQFDAAPLKCTYRVAKTVSAIQSLLEQKARIES